ncbi:Ribonuclease J [uncultured archaeon]|nr:Ribonuclease J [uncultured archaeon]
MDVQFLGGASEVGRSAILLKGSKRMVLDYGVKLDDKTEYPLPAGSVDACVLSHSHLDHSGAFPMLYQTRFPVTYGTEPTKELSELLIDDSLKINRKHHQQQRFSKQQLKTFLNNYAAYEFGSRIELGEYTISLHDAGHTLGSAITLIENGKGKRLVYTGDFKLTPQILQDGAEVVKSDVLLIESTYATREHPDRDELTKKFVQDVRATLDNGGTALVPVFAVGRAQEMVALLYKNNLVDYVHLDGMARTATEITMRHPEFVKNGNILRDALNKMTWVKSEQHRGHAVSGPSIIVTTAGMLNGGPVLNYLTKLNNNSKIFLTGYQVEGTNGRKLMEGKPITIDGEKHLIRTPFAYYDFSAHSGASDLYNYVKASSPETVICVHGDKANTADFAENLRMEGFEAHAPKIGEELKLKF